MRAIRILPLWLAASMALCAADSPSDCMTANGSNADPAPFFLCLNVHREGCVELLHKVQSECGQDSRKYQIVFERYLTLRTRANVLLDQVAFDLRRGKGNKSQPYTPAMQEISDMVAQLEGSDKGLTCEGNPTRFLEFLAPIFTSAFTDKVQELLKSWLSGHKEEREARASELANQRWKLPSELGVPYPGPVKKAT